jgi:hypothetical protein
VSDPERIVTAVGTLFRALSHLIRGDLSVISNDLSFLATLVPEGEVERAKNRCNSVISTLHSLQFLKDTHFKPVETSGHALFQHLFPGIQITTQDNRSIIVDTELTQGVLSLLVPIFFDEGVGTLQLHCSNADSNHITYVVESTSYRRELTSDIVALDILTGATKILGESSIPKVALGELILAAQDARCCLQFSSQRKKIVALEFTFPCCLQKAETPR